MYAVYLWQLQPVVLQRLDATLGFQGTDILLGSILLGLPLLELVGVYLKNPVSAYYAKHYFSKHIEENPKYSSLGVAVFILAAILHLGMAVALLIIAFQALGMRTGDDAALWLQLVFIIVLFVTIAKEAFFIILWLNPFGGATIPPPQISTQLACRDLLGDVLLQIFAAIGYTVLWDALLAPIYLSARTGVVIGQYIALVFHFLLIYPLLRSIYLFQEFYLENSRTARIWSLLAFVGTLVVAMVTVTRR